MDLRCGEHCFGDIGGRSGVPDGTRLHIGRAVWVNVGVAYDWDSEVLSWKNILRMKTLYLVAESPDR